MKKALILLLLCTFVLPITAELKTGYLENFTVMGRYNVLNNGNDYLTLSFWWQFKDNQIPANEFHVYAGREHGWEEKVLHMEISEFPQENIRLGYIWTEDIDYDISEINQEYVDFETFFMLPAFKFTTVVKKHADNYADTNQVNFTFTEPLCVCVTDEVPSKIGKGDTYKTQVDADHTNPDEKLTYEVSEFDALLKKRYPDYQYPTGITIDDQGIIEYEGKIDGKFGVVAYAIDESEARYPAVITFEVAGISSVDEIELEGGVYPNPASDVLNLDTEMIGFGMQIYNASGIPLKTIINAGETLNVSDLPQGTYFLKSNGRFAKFVISR